VSINTAIGRAGRELLVEEADEGNERVRLTMHSCGLGQVAGEEHQGRARGVHETGVAIPWQVAMDGGEIGRSHGRARERR
jgi:hypothetical protein